MMLKWFCVIKWKVTVSLSRLMSLTDFTNYSYVVAFVRFVNNSEIQKTFSVAKSCPTRAKRKICLMPCLHIWKQKSVSGEPCRHLYWWCPIKVSSIRGFNSPVKKILTHKQRIALFIENCWFQKPLEMIWKNSWIMQQKWLTLSVKGQSISDYLKTVQKPWQTAHTSLATYKYSIQVYKRPPLDLILSQLNPVPKLIYYSFITNFNVALPFTGKFQMWVPFSTFWPFRGRQNSSLRFLYLLN
jgi:hypothetical protein